MDFSAFRAFDDAFRGKYADLLESHPFAAMLIEKQLRNYESGALAIAGANIRKLARPTCGRRFRAQMAFRLASLLNREYEPRYYLKLERFDTLKSNLSSPLSGLGMKPLREAGGGLMPEMRVLHQLATLGGAFRTFMRTAHAKGIEKATADRKLVSRLDKQASKNFALVKAMIEKQRIQLFIADGDTLPFSRMICAAAKELAVPYVVIAHGYIQNPNLVGIAPIYGDYLVTWTEQQAADLRKALKDEEKAKVLCFGYPKDTYCSNVRGNQALIVWHPLHDGDLVSQVEEIRGIIGALRAAGYGSRLRLHPRDTNARSLRALFSNTEIEFSEAPLADDLERSALVIGSRSSVLVEAAMSGKRVFQLAAYSTTPLEGVAPIELGRSFEASLNVDQQQSAWRPFNYEAFLNFVQRIQSSHQ
ncbi:hypothetical protein predicted by Glimmer/Critica (plasmid) [Sinorhizobium fredii HH103]|uniref:Uncharacterized protein n=1 Tax=Sinorhizobium fredii (strain HH103) TaxID=1117943 RepID=G9AIA1_SINF1|nr:hypothetical protein [Sinorhizobium fredii]CCF00783.1 hypothetical protein predicted by Glimmer/Critica [Sinorhizobium fredii HH103]